MNLKLTFTKFLYLLTAASLVVFYTSCKKEAGEGGSASIRGAVKVQNWNGNFTMLNGEWKAADEWVYIIYGDDLSYGDRERTNYNGQYEFKYLREGNYKVYVYSKDSTRKALSGDTVVVKEVKISKRKEVVDAPEIVIFK